MILQKSKSELWMSRDGRQRVAGKGWSEWGNLRSVTWERVQRRFTGLILELRAVLSRKARQAGSDFHGFQKNEG